MAPIIPDISLTNQVAPLAPLGGLLGVKKANISHYSEANYYKAGLV